MNVLDQPGRLLIALGCVILAAGLWMTFGERLSFGPGRLPLDFRIEREHYSIYIPLGTCLLASAILSLILMWLNRSG